MLTSFEKTIFDALADEATQNNFEIVDVSVVGSKHSPILKVFIDTQSGVSFNELSNAQSWITPIIEQIDPFSTPYTLEVSSPGIDRPLVLLSHFKRFVGEKAHIRVQMPVDERRNFNAKIKSVDGDVILVVDDDGEHALEFKNIKRANLIGRI